MGCLVEHSYGVLLVVHAVLLELEQGVTMVIESTGQRRQSLLVQNVLQPSLVQSLSKRELSVGNQSKLLVALVTLSDTGAGNAAVLEQTGDSALVEDRRLGIVAAPVTVKVTVLSNINRWHSADIVQVAVVRLAAWFGGSIDTDNRVSAGAVSYRNQEFTKFVPDAARGRCEFFIVRNRSTAHSV